MAKNYWIWLVAIVALIAVGMFIQGKYNLFSTVPAGQYSAPSDCSFLTNVDPYSSSYSSYTGSATWISIDTNGDGVKEPFKYSSTKTSSGTLAECGGTGSGSNGISLLADFNSAGDDIYLADKLYICSSDKKSSKYFVEDSTSSLGQILTCSGTPTCPTGQTMCSDGTCKADCGTTVGSCLIQDTNSNGKVDRSELGTAINRWVTNT